MKSIVFVCLITCVATVAIFAAPASVSTPAVWRYAHPEAKALVGIEWSRMVNSPIGQQVRAKFAESEIPAVPGMELLDAIQSVFISSPGNPAGSTQEQPPAVIAVQGQFDLDQIRALAAERTAKEGVYRSIPLLEDLDAENREMALALVSPQTLLLGDLASVKAAIDSHEAADPAATESPLFTRAMALAADNDLWLVSEISPTDFAQSGGDSAQFLNDVESVEIGLSLRDGLGAELSLGTASPESAQSLAGGLQFMLAMILSSQQNSEAGARISEKLQVSTDDTRVRLALELDQTEFANAFRDMGSSMSFGGSGAEVDVRGTVQGSDSWSWEQEPVLPAEEQVIRIWGMEGGPVEIPMGE